MNYLPMDNPQGLRRSFTCDKDTAHLYIRFRAISGNGQNFKDGGLTIFELDGTTVIGGADIYWSVNAAGEQIINKTFDVAMLQGHQFIVRIVSSGAGVNDPWDVLVRDFSISTDPIP